MMFYFSILLYCDGVELIIEGGDSKEFGGTKKGRIYLTTHRVRRVYSLIIQISTCSMTLEIAN